MRRVSSRQRLVSWDAFEANDTSFNQSDNDSEQCSSQQDEEVYWYSSAPLMPYESLYQPHRQPYSRKRERDDQPLPELITTMTATTAALALVLDTPPVIPAFDFEPAKPQELYLDDLPQDLHMNILSFLDIDTIRNVMTINRRYRNLFLSDTAETFWIEQVRSMWPLLPEGKLRFMDALQLPTAAGAYFKHGVNFPLLLSMTPKLLPTKVDESLLGACLPNSRRRLYANLYSTSRRRREHEPDEILAYNDDEKGRVIKYTGIVGSGDRCIRSNHPLPRPQRKLHFKQGQNLSLFELLRRGSIAIRGMSVSAWRPFVAPYVEKDNSIQVAPRMVAYFEVSILRRQDEECTPTISSRDCVAVGIATESFHCRSKMPGWDSQSFGYHGDDGGTFHASGGMVERFGPCFGEGDTVGCGIDYVTRGIFFTLNGNFLGYGWKNLDVEFLEHDLYGVVGIDTNHPIALNYGDQPFDFDLSKFTQKHKKLIFPYYQWSQEEEDPLLDDLPSYPEV